VPFVGSNKANKKPPLLPQNVEMLLKQQLQPKLDLPRSRSRCGDDARCRRGSR
jgi:hypothetical protein